MGTKSIRVFGLGGHGRELAGIAEAAGYVCEGYYDDVVPAGPTPFGLCFGKLETNSSGAPVVVGIGEPLSRSRAVGRLVEAGVTFADAIVHPTAAIGPRVRLSAGVVVGSNSSITADTTVAPHSHLHSGVVVSHDCSIGRYCLVGPRVALAGGVNVGDFVFLGVGVSVSPSVSIGDKALVGAGAAVITDVVANAVVAGVPARGIDR